jgi:outer membrane protein assembly factor BamB
MTVPFFAASNGSWIRATPAIDGGRIYVAGMRDLLVCLDAETGAEVWRVDFVKDLKSELPAFGFVSSPLIIGDAVYVQAGGGFCKLDKATGKLLWRVLDDGGGMNGSAFSSPLLTTLGGVQQLLVQGRTDLAAVDPDTGNILWRRPVEAFRGMNIVTPTVSDGKVFTTSYGGGSFLFDVPAPGAQPAEPLWRNKVQGYMSSPIVRDGHAYVHLRNQRFASLDLATGKEDWITEPFGKYWSLVAQGDRILALDETGDLRLVRATPEKFELVGEAKVANRESWAHLAVTAAADGSIGPAASHQATRNSALGAGRPTLPVAVQARATSSTHRARKPARARMAVRCGSVRTAPPSPSRAVAGMKPTTPQACAGWRTLPARSLPTPSGTTPAATSAASPPLEPPGPRPAASG